MSPLAYRECQLLVGCYGKSLSEVRMLVALGVIVPMEYICDGMFVAEAPESSYREFSRNICNEFCHVVWGTTIPVIRIVP
jgi:hypothetical protein